MQKFLFLAFVLWQGMYEIAGDYGFRSTDTNPASFSSSPHQRTVYSNKIISNSDELEYPDSHVTSITCNCNDVSPRENTESGLRNRLGPGYRVTDGVGAHKLHLRKLPWNKARKICAQDGGNLAVIRSDSEENILLQMMREGAVEDAWLGVHDKFEEGDWATVTDEPLAQTGWAKWSGALLINPDNFLGLQHCARLITNGGGMDDDYCYVYKQFVCKISNT